jgi:hypothetical protein
MSNADRGEDQTKVLEDGQLEAKSGAGIEGDPTGSGSGYKGPKGFPEFAKAQVEFFESGPRKLWDGSRGPKSFAGKEGGRPCPFCGYPLEPSSVTKAGMVCWAENRMVFTGGR